MIKRLTVAVLFYVQKGRKSTSLFFRPSDGFIVPMVICGPLLFSHLKKKMFRVVCQWTFKYNTCAMEVQQVAFTVNGWMTSSIINNIMGK